MPHLPPDQIPYPKLMPEEQILISDKHGLSGDWKLLMPRGNVHAVYRVGDVVVRVPRDHPEWIQDTYTEAVALEAMQNLPISTPKLVVFDDDRDVVGVPFAIIEHFPGTPFVSGNAGRDQLWRLGQAISQLHRLVTVVDDPQGRLDQVAFEECRKWAEEATLSEEEMAWAKEIMDRCEPLLESNLSRVFVHNDLHELNLLSNADGDIVMIDWGDAGWGDPAFDFSVLPPHWLPDVLKSYQSTSPLVHEAWARIVWNQLGLSLRRLAGAKKHQTRGRRRFDALRQVADQVLEGSF